MKRSFYEILFINIIVLWMPSAMASAENQDSQENIVEKAKLIIYRPDISPPLAYKPMIEINSVKAFYLPRGYHAEMNLDPGEYHLKADWKPFHGVSDKELVVNIQAGKTAYVSLNNSLDIAAIILGSMGINSKVSEESQVDLSGSRKITRYQSDWLNSSTGGFVPDETLNERYDLTINNEKIIEDFLNSDDSKKMEIARYLIGREIYDEQILIVFEQVALENYKKQYANKNDAQPLAFICKYIASSRMPEFKPTIAKISTGASSKYIRGYASKYLNAYYNLVAYSLDD